MWVWWRVLIVSLGMATLFGGSRALLTLRKTSPRPTPLLLLSGRVGLVLVQLVVGLVLCNLRGVLGRARCFFARDLLRPRGLRCLGRLKRGLCRWNVVRGRL